MQEEPRKRRLFTLASARGLVRKRDQKKSPASTNAMEKNVAGRASISHG
jgi:hypothetical protein